MKINQFKKIMKKQQLKSNLAQKKMLQIVLHIQSML